MKGKRKLEAEIFDNPVTVGELLKVLRGVPQNTLLGVARYPSMLDGPIVMVVESMPEIVLVEQEEEKQNYSVLLFDLSIRR